MGRSKVAGWPCAAFSAAILGVGTDTTLFPKKPVMIIDIHSHSTQVVANQIKVLSVSLHPETIMAELLAKFPSELIISVGVHPWHASEWSNANIHLIQPLLASSRIKLIGEIGLDNVCGVPLQDQLHIFETQLQIAETQSMSVIVHNVGHQAELLAVKRKYKNIPAWIIHGFRGKPQAAEQYLNNGFHLSFGPKHHPDALRLCPLNRLFLETDESDTDLDLLYSNVAFLKGLSIQALEQAIAQNVEALGIK